MRTYADSGKSGLRLDGRDALKQLIDDVRSGAADFSAILVYDVSRWGRFQDADESAYYEFICKEAGIAVHYCAEQFENDGSLSATIIKSMKRAMAGEYSRELSVKVFAGQCRLIGLGFRQGGMAGYGLRRQLDRRAPAAEGRAPAWRAEEPPDRPRHPGPRAARGDRDGSADVPDVRRGRSVRTGDRHLLNDEGVLTDLGRPWTRGTVHQVLTNEKYIGQQRLQPDLLQAEEEARRQSSRHVDQGQTAPSRRSSNRRSSTPSGGSSKSEADDSRTRRCSNALAALLKRRVAVGTGDRRARRHAVEFRIPDAFRQSAPRVPTRWLLARSGLRLRRDQSRSSLDAPAMS